MAQSSNPEKCKLTFLQNNSIDLAIDPLVKEIIFCEANNHAFFNPNTKWSFNSNITQRIIRRDRPTHRYIFFFHWDIGFDLIGTNLYIDFILLKFTNFFTNIFFNIFNKYW